MAKMMKCWLCAGGYAWLDDDEYEGQCDHCGETLEDVSDVIWE